MCWGEGCRKGSREVSHAAKPLTPIGGMPARLDGRISDLRYRLCLGWERVRDLPYLSLQFPAMPVVPVQRMMMLDFRDRPVQ